MAEQVVQKARLIELDEHGRQLPEGEGEGKGRIVTVQFNPETLKLQFANQIQNGSSGSSGSGASGGDQASGTAGRQFVGAGTTKLSVQLWFDATAGIGHDRVDDVRRLTQQVIYFVTPKPLTTDKTKLVPPQLRFHWGSFIFDGLVESIEETLEFFSPKGLPLRASIALGMSQQTILVSKFDAAPGPSGTALGPGVLPLTLAAAGSTLQGLAAGSGRDWQSVAAANGIDNPRQLQPGQLIDLSARPRSTF